MDSLTKEALRDRYEKVIQLLSSQEWDMWVEFMKRRRTYFQHKLNGEVRSGNLVQAQIYLALIEDAESMISEFKKEPKRIEKEISHEVQ